MARIYLRSELPRDPRVQWMARELQSSVTVVVGACTVLWMHADEHSHDGIIECTTAADIDELVRTPGFAAAMQRVGWLEIRPATEFGTECVVIPRFAEHCGADQKHRRDDRRRQARRRGRLKGAAVEAIAARDGMRCGICGLRVTHAEVGIDHIVPIGNDKFALLGADGDSLINLQLSHLVCNRGKGNRIFRHPRMPELPDIVQRYLGHESRDAVHESRMGGSRDPAASSASASASASATATRKKNPPVVPPSRRVPDGFALTPERLAFGIELGLTEPEVRFQWDKFADFDFRTAHTDWDRTWRNWMRTTVERGNNGPRPPTTAAEKSSAVAHRLLEKHRAKG